MALLRGAEKAAVLARHDPKAIVLVARRYREGVISLGDHHGVAVFHFIHFVDIALGRVDCLEAKALRLIKFVIVDFVQSALARKIVHVVLVRRIAAPFSVLYPELADVKVICLARLGEGKRNLTNKRALTERLYGNISLFDLKGAKVTAAQVIELSGLLGVEIVS